MHLIFDQRPACTSCRFPRQGQFDNAATDQYGGGFENARVVGFGQNNMLQVRFGLLQQVVGKTFWGVMPRTLTALTLLLQALQTSTC